MTTTFDVIVVGAGPGGSNAAAVALAHGLTVAQVERHSFPRAKPCGGGFTLKSSKAVRVAAALPYRGEFAEVEVNVWRRSVNRFSHPPLLVRMVVRSEFDAWLVAQNGARTGFQFYDGERVREISYDGRFRVRTDRRTLVGRQLVGADGAYSLVNRVFSIGRPRGHAVAVEVTLSRDEASLPAELPPCFDIGAIDPGYGWVFPKDDHWNVGLYTPGKSRDLRRQLTDYIRAKGFELNTDPLATFASHQFPCGGYRPSPPKAPVYLVGDAAGFGDALTGEGIYHALESGRIAGETAHDVLAGTARPRDYYRRLRRPVLLDTFLSYQLARALYRSLDRAAALVRNPLVWRPMIQSYAAGTTLGETIRRGGVWGLSGTAARAECVSAGSHGAGD
jgi:menaquinone-9 beta-reductase